MAQGPSIANISNFQKALDDYVRATGQTPAKLTDVPEIADQAKYSPAVLDSWGRPYAIMVVKGRAMVVSYGRDGRPGGVGLDADITVKSRYVKSTVTLPQFVQVAELRPVLLICAAAALATALITFLAGTSRPGRRTGLLAILLSAAVTGAAAVFVGSIIAAVHAPSGR